MVSDFCDGSVYKKHSLFSSDSDVCSLEIMAYYDDVEVCNPLGSRAKKHKLGMYVLWRFHSCYDAYYISVLLYTWEYLSKAPFISEINSAHGNFEIQ